MKAIHITAILLSTLLLVACGKQQQQNISANFNTEQTQSEQKSTDPKIEWGKRVYDETGCATCHSLSGVGGSIGPKLDGVGKKLSAEKLRKILLNPKSQNPNTVMPPFEGSEEDLDALVTYLMSLR